MAWQASWNGTVRPAARAVRLRAWPAPRTWRASSIATSMLHLAAYRSMTCVRPAPGSVVTRATSYPVAEVPRISTTWTGRGAEDAVPQAGDSGGVHGGGLAVAGDGDRDERRGGGEAGRGRQLVSLGARAAPPAGPGWREIVQRGVLAQPGGPGDGGRESRQFLPGVGGVGDHVDVPPGQHRSEGLGHAARQPQPRGRAGALDDQLGQHRDGHGPAEDGQPHDDGGDYPVVAVPGLVRPRRRAVAEPRRGPGFLPAPLEQGVVNRDSDRLPGRDQQRH